MFCSQVSPTLQGTVYLAVYLAVDDPGISRAGTEEQTEVGVG